MNRTRTEARKLIDAIPDDRLPFVRAMLYAVLEEEEKTVIEPCYDDELTDADRTAIAAAHEDIKAGRIRDWDDAKKDLGL